MIEILQSAILIRLHLITSDNANAAQFKNLRRVQSWTKWKVLPEDLPIRDGPENSRVKVIDVDPETGERCPNVKLIKPKWLKYSYFDVGKKKDYKWNNLRCVSLFSIVIRILELIEDHDTLGRRLSWSFGEQLQIEARSGDKPNASYSRDDGCLRFYFFESKKIPDLRIHLADSPDIVAHETGHAIVDAIAPDLYLSKNLQSRAIHEAVADLTAVLLAFEMDDLGSRILKATNGRLDEANAFGWIAEEFGGELEKETGDTYLRTLYNSNSLDPKSKNFLDTRNSHKISTILSGAIFAALIEEFERRKNNRAWLNKITPFSASGKTLWEVGGFTRRMLFRGLDYLPPGDNNFIDIIRAMISTDTVAYPSENDSSFRNSLIEKCLERGIGTANTDLKFTSNIENDPIPETNIAYLRDRPAFAQKFVKNNRDFFLTPSNVDLEVSGRVSKKIDYHKGNKTIKREELILKVRWTETQAGQSIWGINRFEVVRGTTVVIDMLNKRSKVRLSNSPVSKDVHQIQSLEVDGLPFVTFNIEASNHAAIH